MQFRTIRTSFLTLLQTAEELDGFLKQRFFLTDSVLTAVQFFLEGPATNLIEETECTTFLVNYASAFWLLFSSSIRSLPFIWGTGGIYGSSCALPLDSLRHLQTYSLSNASQVFQTARSPMRHSSPRFTFSSSGCR